MKILYDNQILDSTVTCSNVNSSYPIANIQDTRLSKYFRSDTDADFGIIINLTGLTASYIAILNHNLSSGATITLQANATDSWGAPTFSQAITWGSGMIVQSFTEQTFAYWRLLISDNSNPDTYIKIGHLYLSGSLTLPAMAQDQVVDKKTTSKNSISYSGQAYGKQMYMYRSAKVNFPFISLTQRDDMLDLFISQENIYPVIVLIWEANLDIESPIYSVIDQDSFGMSRNGKIAKPFKMSFQIREVF